MRLQYLPEDGKHGRQVSLRPAHGRSPASFPPPRFFAGGNHDVHRADRDRHHARAAVVSRHGGEAPGHERHRADRLAGQRGPGRGDEEQRGSLGFLVAHRRERVVYRRQPRVLLRLHPGQRLPGQRPGLRYRRQPCQPADPDAIDRRRRRRCGLRLRSHPRPDGRPDRLAGAGNALAERRFPAQPDGQHHRSRDPVQPRQRARRSRLRAVPGTGNRPGRSDR